MKKPPMKWNAPSRTPQSPRDQNHSYFQITGVVDHGDQRGRLLGFPTANIAIPQSDVHNGVWAGTVHLGSQNRRSLYVAAVSIGARPTYYARGQSLLEAHLLDYSGDLYGQTIVVTLRALIRPQRRFAGTPELVDQIQDDVARVRNWAVRADLGGYLREEQGTNRSLSNPPGAGPP